MSFGAYLKTSRELRELSLPEVAAATKLPQRIVAALEADDFGELRDRGFALHAARSCASAIGLDPEETALRLEEEWSKSMPPSAPRPLWRRAIDSLPREPGVWIVLAVTLLACIVLLLRH